MTVRRLALLVCLLLTVTALPPAVPASTPSPVTARTAPARAAAVTAARPPCCCRPGHCHMAMCHGPVSCACRSCGPAPRPGALLPDGGSHRRGPLVGAARFRLSPLLTSLLSVPRRDADALRVRPVSPPEEPPRAC